MTFLSSCFALQSKAANRVPGRSLSFVFPFDMLRFLSGAVPLAERHEGESLFLGSAERNGQRKGHRVTDRVQRSKCAVSDPKESDHDVAPDWLGLDTIHVR